MHLKTVTAFLNRGKTMPVVLDAPASSCLDYTLNRHDGEVAWQTRRFLSLSWRFIDPHCRVNEMKYEQRALLVSRRCGLSTSWKKKKKKKKKEKNKKKWYSRRSLLIPLLHPETRFGFHQQFRWPESCDSIRSLACILDYSKILPDLTTRRQWSIFSFLHCSTLWLHTDNAVHVVTWLQNRIFWR